MQKRRFRKISKRISVYSVPKDQHCSRSTEYDDVLFSVVDTWCNSYAEQLLLKDRIRTSNSIDWSCFSCKAKLSINVEHLLKHKKLLSEKTFFCDKCQPHYKKANKLMLLKYMNSFYAKVKQIIKQNSNMIQYL